MGGCVSACIGGMCASACSKACCGRSTETKGGHLILLFLGTVLALVLRYWGGPLLIHLYVTTLDLCTDSDKCYGEGAVYRISLALFIFYFFHAMAMKATDGSCLRKPSMASNWMLKILFFILLLVAAFFIPNQFYDDGYVQIARVVSAVFLILQIILLIDFAYRWNENWMADDKEWTRAIIAISVFLYVGCLTLFGFMTHWFGGSGCDRNNFFLATTFLLPMLFTCISVTNWCEHGALLTSAVVTTYCYWLGFSALSSDPSSCNMLSSTSNETLHLVIGLLIAALTVTYAGWSLSNTQIMGGELHEDKQEKLDSSNDKDPEKQSEQHVQEQKDEAEEAAEEAVQTSIEDVKLATKFHIFMACSACYMAMLLTSWGATVTETGQPSSYDISTENVWIKIVTQWLTCLLYLWTLVAPSLCKSRDF